jgi:hypothetical protein
LSRDAIQVTYVRKPTLFCDEVRGEGAAARQMRCVVMPTFRIFYFRHNVLDHAEEVEAPSVVDAAARVSGNPPDLEAEIWSDKGRVGIIGASRDAAHQVVEFLPKSYPRMPS